MFLKPETWKSKTLKAGIATILGGIAACIVGDYANGVNLIAGGIIAICLRDSNAPSPPFGGTQPNEPKE